MATKSMWEYVADIMEEKYGAFVDRNERYFICPDCGEPVYEKDWHETSYVIPEDCTCCPICGFIPEIDEREEDGWHEFEPGKFIWDEMEANP